MRFFCLLAAGVLVAVPAQAQSARDVLTEVAKCADIAAIRLPLLGKVDSLNLSATAAVLFYEALRQKQEIPEP